MGVPYVITTEMEPDTAWGKGLSVGEGALIIAEKIHDSVELAADLGVTILLEPHGPVTDTINGMEAILERCGKSSNLGVNLEIPVTAGLVVPIQLNSPNISKAGSSIFTGKICQRKWKSNAVKYMGQPWHRLR